MRIASFEQNGWQLRCAETSHRNHPKSFWIPAELDRTSLKVGQAAKLIFEIEKKLGDGFVLESERMWVLVSKVVGERYLSILDNQPTTTDFKDPEEYLIFGAEVLFEPRHIIDIAEPPKDYVEWQLGQKPERTWPQSAEDGQAGS